MMWVAVGHFTLIVSDVRGTVQWFIMSLIKGRLHCSLMPQGFPTQAMAI